MRAVRLVLGLSLIWIIYQQAGWATALFAALMLLHTENVGFTLARHADRLNVHIARIRDLTYRPAPAPQQGGSAAPENIALR